MSPALSVSLIWLLTMLGSAAHMSSARSVAAGLVPALGAFAVVFFAASFLSPQPNWVGVCVGFAAIWRLIVGPMPRTGSLIAGASAAAAAALQVAGGLPDWLAATLGLSALLVAGFTRRRGAEGHQSYREQILIVTALATPAIGLAADAVYGWRSATALNRPSPPIEIVVLPGWAFVLLALAFAAGILKGVWVSR